MAISKKNEEIKASQFDINMAKQLFSYYIKRKYKNPVHTTFDSSNMKKTFIKLVQKTKNPGIVSQMVLLENIVDFCMYRKIPITSAEIYINTNDLISFINTNESCRRKITNDTMSRIEYQFNNNVNITQNDEVMFLLFNTNQLFISELDRSNKLYNDVISAYNKYKNSIMEQQSIWK